MAQHWPTCRLGGLAIFALVLSLSAAVPTSGGVDDSECSLLQVSITQRQQTSELAEKESAVVEASRDASDGGASAQDTHTPISVWNIDENGRLCKFCGPPSADRVDKTYATRKDCGNYSSIEGIPSKVKDVPLVNFNRQFGDASCALNYEKACADAVLNRDFVYFPKVVDLGQFNKSVDVWDGAYCKKNGFLESSAKSLANNFTALQSMGSNLCDTKYAKYKWNIATLRDFQTAVANSTKKSVPTVEEAEYIAALKCALFNKNLGCEIAFCAYTYCEKSDGTTGAYDECPGFSQLRGNI